MNINLIIEDYDRLKSIKKVAEIHNTYFDKIRIILKNNGIFMVCKNTKNKNNIPKAIEEYKQGTSLNQLNKKYGFDHNVFKRILKENGIDYINRSKVPIKGEGLIIKDKLNDILSAYKENKNVRKTSKLFKVKECNLYRFLKSENLLIKKHGKISIEKENQIKDEIYDLYVNQNLNTSDIGKKYNITRYNIKKILTSNFGESIIKTKSDITSFMNYSIEHQTKCHKGLAKKSPYILPSGKIIGLQGYEHDFLDYTFKHSNLSEDDFNFENKLRIKLSDKKIKHKHYYPDFYLQKYNMVIEIKSWYTFNMNVYLNKKKIKKTKESGYTMLLIKDKKYSKYRKFLETHNLLK